MLSEESLRIFLSHYHSPNHWGVEMVEALKRCQHLNLDTFDIHTHHLRQSQVAKGGWRDASGISSSVRVISELLRGLLALKTIAHWLQMLWKQAHDVTIIYSLTIIGVYKTVLACYCLPSHLKQSVCLRSDSYSSSVYASRTKTIV